MSNTSIEELNLQNIEELNLQNNITDTKKRKGDASDESSQSTEEENNNNNIDSDATSVEFEEKEIISRKKNKVQQHEQNESIVPVEQYIVHSFTKICQQNKQIDWEHCCNEAMTLFNVQKKNWPGDKTSPSLFMDILHLIMDKPAFESCITMHGPIPWQVWEKRIFAQVEKVVINKQNKWPATEQCLLMLVPHIMELKSQLKTQWPEGSSHVEESEKQNHHCVVVQRILSTFAGVCLYTFYQNWRTDYYGHFETKILCYYMCRNLSFFELQHAISVFLRCHENHLLNSKDQQMNIDLSQVEGKDFFARLVLDAKIHNKYFYFAHFKKGNVEEIRISAYGWYLKEFENEVKRDQERESNENEHIFTHMNKYKFTSSE